jgi:hypothetical protein
MNCKEMVNNFSRDRTRNEGERTYQDDLRAFRSPKYVGYRWLGTPFPQNRFSVGGPWKEMTIFDSSQWPEYLPIPGVVCSFLPSTDTIHSSAFPVFPGNSLEMTYQN